MIHGSAIERQIIADWAEELSAKLSRPKELILERGLQSDDFPNGELRITFVDDSLAHFKFSFFVTNSSRREVAIFTEHCGYHVFPLPASIQEATGVQYFEDEE
jgi:hypothetical protein